MSKGTRQFAFRLEPRLIEQIDQFCARSVHFRHGEPDTRATFVRKAIEERLAKLERGRRKKDARNGTSQVEGDPQSPLTVVPDLIMETIDGETIIDIAPGEPDIE